MSLQNFHIYLKQKQKDYELACPFYNENKRKKKVKTIYSKTSTSTSNEIEVIICGEVEGVDLLICKQCWGVGITAKSLDSVISPGSLLDERSEGKITTSGDCKCPMCSTIMDEIELEIPENVVDKISMIESETSSLSTSKTVIIDSCSNCPSFWFDAGELDLLNGITPKLRGSNYDKKTVRLLEDHTLTEEDFQRKMAPHLGPYSFRYHNSLNKFGRGLPKDHSCEIILKYDQ